MKTTIAMSSRTFAPSSARVLAIVGAALLTARLAVAAEVPTDPATRSGDGAANSLLAVEVPLAVFDNIPTQGKDPFFPSSTRRAPVIKAVIPLTPTTSANTGSQLTLRGISGPPAKRIALINNLTFVAGEEGKVRVPTGLLKVRVIEVKDSSATIQIEGENSLRELRLRDSVAEKHAGITINSDQLMLSQKPKTEQ